MSAYNGIKRPGTFLVIFSSPKQIYENILWRNVNQNFYYNSPLHNSQICPIFKPFSKVTGIIQYISKGGFTLNGVKVVYVLS